MGKKETPAKKEDDVEEVDEDLFSSEVDEEFPELEPKEEEIKEEALDESDLEGEMDAPVVVPEIIEEYYKYLKLKLKKKRENDYELIIDGQTHGFCNIFIKYLLTVEGIDMAAYKSTTIEPAMIFIRVKNGYDIKKLISKGIDLLEKK